MKKSINLLIITLVVISIFAILRVELLSNITTNEKQTINSLENTFETKANEGKKILELNTSWGDYLDSYMKDGNDEYYNPRQDISNDHKVRVIKMEYSDGIECKNGFYKYGLITQVFDNQTGELLNSVGYYTNNKE